MAYPYGQSNSYPFVAGFHPPPPYSQAAFASYPSARQYFMIRSRLNGLVLDIEGGGSAPGTPVILWNTKSGGNENQLWYQDMATGTIRSKLNDYVLEVRADGIIVVNPFHSGNVNQLWDRSDPHIRHRFSGRVLDVSGGNTTPGSRIIAFDFHGNVNQLFDWQAVPTLQPTVNPSFPTPVAAPAPMKRGHFFIISEMNCKVLDIEGDRPVSGAKVIMWTKKGGRPANQLWYFDNEGTIRSVLNDFALEATRDCEAVSMMPFTGSPHQRWTLVGNRIMKNSFECLDIAGESKKDGAKVVSYRYKGSANQHWRLEYV